MNCKHAIDDLPGSQSDRSYNILLNTKNVATKMARAHEGNLNGIKPSGETEKKRDEEVLFCRHRASAMKWS